jgi:hypothetical protein
VIQADRSWSSTAKTCNGLMDSSDLQEQKRRTDCIRTLCAGGVTHGNVAETLKPERSSDANEKLLRSENEEPLSRPDEHELDWCTPPRAPGPTLTEGEESHFAAVVARGETPSKPDPNDSPWSRKYKMWYWAQPWAGPTPNEDTSSAESIRTPSPVQHTTSPRAKDDAPPKATRPVRPRRSAASLPPSRRLSVGRYKWGACPTCAYAMCPHIMATGPSARLQRKVTL